jgi:hypothetical protein
MPRGKQSKIISKAADALDVLFQDQGMDRTPEYCRKVSEKHSNGQKTSTASGSDYAFMAQIRRKLILERRMKVTERLNSIEELDDGEYLKVNVMSIRGVREHNKKSRDIIIENV